MEGTFMTRAMARLSLSRRQTLVGALVALMTAALLAANIHVARAHNWEGYHWDKGGSAIHIYNYNYAANWQAAENARVDGWNKIGILYNYSVDYHTDVSVFDGYYGTDTGWSGLATLEDLDWSWGHFGWVYIAHGHARYNRSYPMSQASIQGIFCQEIGHTWGFDHSNTGDCMGKTYYNDINTYGPHNNTDFYNRYRNH
jgi:hypothetical protein